MASKKKPAPKKASKPAQKAGKPARTAGKPAAKKTVKKPVPPKHAAKKAVKPVAKAAKKPVAKPAQKPVAKPVAAPVKPVVVAKPAEKPVVALKKPGAHDPKSLVSIKPAVKPVIKKEPPKPGKVVIPKTTTKSSVKYEPEFTKSVLDTNPMYEQNGPTMRYSDADLAEFREIIQRKLDAAKKELAYLQGLITRRDEGGDMDEARYMTMEDGSVSMEREQLSQMASRQITFIDHLEKAMMRIENKTYGICRVTGKLIDKARLRAVPHATLSIEAKQMMNK
ncbi:MAG TPA: TraR/DksA C4-type zinc finger protein [Chitinophagaceae bacterium]|nr:TraR/DksA C4-type zinc finger protein [Chitinophagaceae bacterium]